MGISKTKIAGGLMIGVSVLNIIIDALNGQATSNIGSHINNVMGALAGSGFIFMRSAIDKLNK